jgi:hypothetical protein
MGVTLTDIDIGSAPDDGTGDDARTAFGYINANNAELELKVEDATEIEAIIAGTVRSYTKQQRFGEASLSDGANISWNLDNAQTAAVTLGGNRTLDNPTNMQAGATYILRVEQDSSGSRTLAYGNAYKWPGGTAPVLTTTGGATDILSFYSDGTSMFGNATLDLQ